MTLGGALIDTSEVVRVLEVQLTLSLSLDKHVTEVFSMLRQLHLIRWSLDDDSVVTLVHVFVVSRVDYLWLARRRDDRQAATCP